MAKKDKKILIASLIIIAIPFIYLYFMAYGLPYPPNKDSIFPNVYLERAIRDVLDKPDGKIMPEDCLGITELDISFADNNTDLEGIQYFTDLEKLVSSGGRLKDLSVLRDLQKLKYLNLMMNEIEDLVSLSNLVNLEHLELQDNNVKDVSALQNLTKLEYLGIRKNPVSSSDVLSELSELMINE